eukprot:5674150-Pyramimonas_sp.AAC.1
MEPDEAAGPPHGPAMVDLESTKISWCVKNTAITSAPFCVHPSLVYREPVTTKVSLPMMMMNDDDGDEMMMR